MAKDIGLIFIHGIGEDQHLDGSAFGLAVNELREWIDSTLPGIVSRVSFQTVRWQEDLEANQAHVFDTTMRTPPRLTGVIEDITQRLKLSLVQKFGIGLFRKLIKRMLPGLFSNARNLLVSYLGDAAAYEHRAGNPDSAYNRIHAKVRDALGEIYREAGDRPVPVFVVAHSFGSHIVSNYIWDAQVEARSRKGNPEALEARRGIWRLESMARMEEIDRSFYAMKTLRCFFSTGCNIALFVSGLKQVEAFQAPSHLFKWITYWDPNDVLSWPLKELTFEGHIPEKPFEGIVTEEYTMDMGGVFPHEQYWKHPQFRDRLAIELLQALDEADSNSFPP